MNCFNLIYDQHLCRSGCTSFGIQLIKVNAVAVVLDRHPEDTLVFVNPDPLQGSALLINHFNFT